MKVDDLFAAPMNFSVMQELVTMMAKDINRKLEAQIFEKLRERNIPTDLEYLKMNCEICVYPDKTHVLKHKGEVVCNWNSDVRIDFDGPKITATMNYKT